MRLTKHGHSCVRLEHGGGTLVVDPGTLSEQTALQGANAVLVTHEHFDHFDKDGLLAAAHAEPELRIWTNAAVAAQLEPIKDRVHVVAHGDVLDIGGLPVHVYGEKHAPTHLDPVGNVGFHIGGVLFHPGDAFTVPEEPVQTLLVPAGGPWLKSIEILDYVAAVAPQQAYSIHEGLFNEMGLQIVDAILGAASAKSMGGREARRIPVGDSVELR
ncbi:MAG TPA: MBL fold metallo-hydrolase [Mycobacteriales bacterium]|nr:MBL fold metallo-hydrolase [Mycobacteriales bacterium]